MPKSSECPPQLPPSDDLRVLVVANKTWEVEPLVSVLLAKKACPVSLTGHAVGLFPRPMIVKDTAPKERLKLTCELPRLHWKKNPGQPPLIDEAHLSRAAIQVWCIEDWMTRTWNTSSPISSSSTSDKALVALPRIAAALATAQFTPDLVIAFGTAGIPTPAPQNGSVTLGSRIFIHDPFANKPKDREARNALGDPMWDVPNGRRDTMLHSKGLHEDLFRNLPDTARHAAEGRFIPAPIHPAIPPIVLSGNGFASVGTVNVTNYDDYIWADEETKDAFQNAERQHEIGSMETTHGLIRLQWEATPFIFVSGLTDGQGLFNQEVTPRGYSQNFVAAHNAAVVIAHLLPELLSLLHRDKLFASTSPASALVQS